MIIYIDQIVNHLQTPDVHGAGYSMSDDSHRICCICGLLIYILVNLISVDICHPTKSSFKNNLANVHKSHLI